MEQSKVIDFTIYDNRLKTFSNWPHAFLQPEDLAKHGFYFLGRGDETRCAFCKVEIMSWKETDRPYDEHKKWSPRCPHLMQPIHPHYASETVRLNTFEDWPKTLKQTPAMLAEAGFYYTGRGDKTKCFYCDGGLKDWNEEDSPWEQHARWFKDCKYVKLVKGEEYIQNIVSKSCTIKTIEKEYVAEDEKEVSNAVDAKLCKICYGEEINACFIPCGHIIACVKCAMTSEKCPICRCERQDVIRIYFS